jgi:hypothetical protein
MPRKPKRERVYVSYRKGDGLWHVANSTRTEHVASMTTKRDAVAAAVGYCRSRAREEGRHLSLYIKGKTGRVQEERTYPRGSDPHPPKG